MKNTIKIFIILLFFFNIAGQNAYAMYWYLVPWQYPKESKARFDSSQFKNDFYQLAQNFQPQINPLYCAVATSVIILNTIYENDQVASQKELEIVKPKAYGAGNIEFKTYSQITLLNDQTDKIKDREIINLQNINQKTENDPKQFDPGLNLKNLADILKIYKLKTEISYIENADSETMQKFRQLLKEVLVDDKKFLIVNFDGKVLGLKTNGHVSPIGAYDQATDSVLIMDVAGHKNGWYWVSVEYLMKSMNTKDGDGYRGYLVVYK